MGNDEITTLAAVSLTELITFIISGALVKHYGKSYGFLKETRQAS